MTVVYFWASSSLRYVSQIFEYPSQADRPCSSKTCFDFSLRRRKLSGGLPMYTIISATWLFAQGWSFASTASKRSLFIPTKKSKWNHILGSCDRRDPGNMFEVDFRLLICCARLHPSRISGLSLSAPSKASKTKRILLGRIVASLCDL